MIEHRPGGSVENWRLFDPRIDIKTGRQVGFVDPEGNFYKFQNGEELFFSEPPNREPMIRETNGNEIPFNEWKNNKIKAEQLVPPELLSKLDTESIKNIILQTSGKNERNGGNILFGYDFSLEDSHREQLRVMVEIGEALLKKDKEKPEWEELQKLIKEGTDKGILLDLAYNPPKWLVDGGETAHVKKIRLPNNNLAGIEVSTRIYNVYKWNSIVKDVKDVEVTSSGTLKGNSAKLLSIKLEKLLDLFEKNNLIS